MNKEKRIRKNEEFQAIIAKKHSSANRCFIIYYDLNKQDNARVGISVSKKLGKAVQRNKIKRQLRMMISETIDFNTFNYDLIVIVRKNFLDHTYDINKNILEKLVKKVTIK